MTTPRPISTWSRFDWTVTLVAALMAMILLYGSVRYVVVPLLVASNSGAPAACYPAGDPADC